MSHSPLKFDFHLERSNKQKQLTQLIQLTQFTQHTAYTAHSAHPAHTLLLTEMPKCSHTQDQRFELVIKGALFEGYQLCHFAREGGKVEPLQEGEFSDALIAQWKKPDDFINEIRDKYDPIRAKKKTSSGGRGSGRSSNNPELADTPYDPCLCSKRVWNQGLGAQCQSAKMDGSEFCTRCMKEFGNKGALPFGYYDQEKPEEDLVTGKKLPWKTLEDFKDTEKKPKMKVGEIREKLEEMGLDTSGKKAELLERLEAALEADHKLPAEDVVEETPKKKKKMIKKVKKNQGKVPSPAPVEKPVKNPRNVEEIVAKNGQVLKLDLGPADPAAGTGLVKGDPDATIDIEDNEQVDSPIPEFQGKEDEEEVDEGEEVEEEEEVEEVEEDEDFDADDFDEIEYEDVDYLYDESTDKVYTMDGTHVGSWDDDKGINWIKTPKVLKIKAANHPE